MTVCLLTINVWSNWMRANRATRENSSDYCSVFLRSRFQNLSGRRNFPIAYSQMPVKEVFQIARSSRQVRRSSACCVAPLCVWTGRDRTEGWLQSVGQASPNGLAQCPRRTEKSNAGITPQIKSRSLFSLYLLFHYYLSPCHYIFFTSYSKFLQALLNQIQTNKIN